MHIELLVIRSRVLSNLLCSHQIKETMKPRTLLILALPIAAALDSQADVLELKNGKALNGKYVGGTAGTIRFETSEGVQVVETGQALALTFTGGGAATAAPATAAPAATAQASAPAPASGTVSLPAGTTLLVRKIGRAHV